RRTSEAHTNEGPPRVISRRPLMRACSGAVVSAERLDLVDGDGDGLAVGRLVGGRLAHLGAVNGGAQRGGLGEDIDLRVLAGDLPGAQEEAHLTAGDGRGDDGAGGG